MRYSTAATRVASGLESLTGNGGDKLAPPTPVRDRAGHYRRNPAGEWDDFYGAPREIQQFIRRHLFAPRGYGLAADDLADLAGMDVPTWWRAVITAAGASQELERVESWDLEPLEDDSDLVGPTELAELVGVSRDTVRQWRARGQLLPADFELDGGRCPVWTLARVREWAALTGRTLEAGPA